MPISGGDLRTFLKKVEAIDVPNSHWLVDQNRGVGKYPFDIDDIDRLIDNIDDRY